MAGSKPPSQPPSEETIRRKLESLRPGTPSERLEKEEVEPVLALALRESDAASAAVEQLMREAADRAKRRSEE